MTRFVISFYEAQGKGRREMTRLTMGEERGGGGGGGKEWGEEGWK